MIRFADLRRLFKSKLNSPLRLRRVTLAFVLFCFCIAYLLIPIAKHLFEQITTRIDSYNMMADDQTDFKSDFDLPREPPNLSKLPRWRMANTGFAEVSTGSLYIYSAFLDERSNQTFVRFMTLLHQEEDTSLECLFNGNDQDGWNMEGIKYEMCENHDKPYRGYIISCKVPEGNENLQWITVRPRPSNSGNTVNIKIVKRISGEAKSDEQPVFKLVSCVPAMYGTKYSAKQIVEFVELSRLLGIDHIFLYVHTFASDDARTVLTFYEGQGFVTLLKWDIPVKPSQTWNFAQIVSIQDCLYRTMGLSNFVIFHDLDEYPIVQQYSTPERMNWHRTLPFLFDMKHSEIIPENSNAIAAVCLSAVYFDVKTYLDINKPLLPITVNSFDQRQPIDNLLAKCIVRPECIFEMGIHHVSKLIPETKQSLSIQAAPPNVALLHHYRQCKATKNCEIVRRNMRMLKYRIQLLRNYNLVLSELKLLSSD